MGRFETMSRPKTRRLRAALVIAAAVLVLLTLGAAPAPAFDRQANESTMLKLINHARTSRGLHSLSAYDALHEAALDHSCDMIRRDYFGHSSLGGAGVSARARQAGYSASGWSQWTVGEVIAWGCGTRGTPQAVFKAWMRSSSHRSIILGKRWRDVGVGCARGTFKGIRGVIMYTVDVGRRVQ
jgi:uncharacterized protein YkwD